MKSKDMKFRLIISAAGLLITVICTILSGAQFSYCIRGLDYLESSQQMHL